MYAKTSRSGLRFFAHAPGAPTCALGLETVAHHLLKLELATAAREAGAHAELEFPGPGGAWRADVLASDPLGGWKTALEAQLSPITAGEIATRTERMAADGVSSIWFSDRRRPPWLGIVPSIRLERMDGESDLTVAEGLARFSEGGWSTVTASLPDFLGWAFTRRIIAHAPRIPLRPPQRAIATVWTAPRYVGAELAQLPPVFHVHVCTCTAPQLVARFQNALYAAQPSDRMGPGAAHLRAHCRACEGRYDKPWRRTGSEPMSMV
ncbi:competence protein CoiA family protein [Streptomyces sp. NPDC055099]